MKKPIEVGQRVAVYRNGNRVCYGVVLEITDTIVDAFAVEDAKGIRHYCYLENLRILKPKPKRVCHCNREPDRWAVYDKDGDYFSTEPTRVEAERTIAEIMEDTGVLAGCWFGPMEEVK